jgi:hypothetical protein
MSVRGDGIPRMGCLVNGDGMCDLSVGVTNRARKYTCVCGQAVPQPQTRRWSSSTLGLMHRLGLEAHTLQRRHVLQLLSRRCHSRHCFPSSVPRSPPQCISRPSNHSASRRIAAPWGTGSSTVCDTNRYFLERTKEGRKSRCAGGRRRTALGGGHWLGSCALGLSLRGSA